MTPRFWGNADVLHQSLEFFPCRDCSFFCYYLLIIGKVLSVLFFLFSFFLSPFYCAYLLRHCGQCLIQVWGRDSVKENYLDLTWTKSYTCFIKSPWFNIEKNLNFLYSNLNLAFNGSVTLYLTHFLNLVYLVKVLG